MTSLIWAVTGSSGTSHLHAGRARPGPAERYVTVEGSTLDQPRPRSEMPGIAVVSVPVTDQDRAIAFYTTHLGFSVVADVPMGPEMRWVQLRAGDEQASITLTTWFET